MNLSTTYMGFELAHPLVPGASPMVDNLDTVRRLEDAGAAMIVMHSLFEEQIVQEELATVRSIEGAEESFREAVAIPVAVKLSPFYSSLANFARSLDQVGVDALVLFNRFYQPDIDIEQL